MIIRAIAPTIIMIVWMKSVQITAVNPPAIHQYTSLDVNIHGVNPPVIHQYTSLYVSIHSFFIYCHTKRHPTNLINKVYYMYTKYGNMETSFCTEDINVYIRGFYSEDYKF